MNKAKHSWHRILVAFILISPRVFPLVNFVAGDGASPERSGVNRARVSDRAQIQLIVDELRSATERGRDGNVRKHATPGFMQTSVPQSAPDLFASDASMHAIRKFPDVRKLCC